MILIAQHQKCCICRLSDRDLAAYHAINEKLIASCKATGKPAISSIAKEFLHLWPGKEGQTDKQRFDNLRKALTRHVDHVAEKIAVAQEEEKEHTKSLSDHAEEIITLCISAHKKAMLAAESKGEIRRDDKGRQRAVGWEPRDFREATQTLFPASNLLSRLTPTANQDQGKSGLEEIRESIRAKRNDMANSSAGLQSG